MLSLDVVLVDLLVDIDVLVGLMDQLQLVLHFVERHLGLIHHLVGRGALAWFLVNCLDLSCKEKVVLSFTIRVFELVLVGIYF